MNHEPPTSTAGPEPAKGRVQVRPPGRSLRLEHEHRAPRVGQIARRAQPGEAGADDDRVGRTGHAGSGARSSQAVTPQVIVSHTQSAPRAAPW